MGVNIQRHADVRMSHDILQVLRVHSGFRHIGAEGMPAYMRGYFGHLDAVDLVVFLDDVLKRGYGGNTPVITAFASVNFA